MADETSAGERPEHEEEHLPGPSFWPALLAVGVAMSLIGVITKLVVVITGLVILLVALGGWIRDARREYRALR
ncbi:MAG TPA: cytochrome c oxidase subunit 4 [Candidatus Dormibacteraeota bacterium]|nr:cytochrome c oxidase subunit 4 [Candidatus Dormibacteraeota bacterium]